jgi:hypothetical protein
MGSMNSVFRISPGWRAKIFFRFCELAMPRSYSRSGYTLARRVLGLGARFVALARLLPAPERLMAECTMYAERVIPAAAAKRLILSSCFTRAVMLMRIVLSV